MSVFSVVSHFIAGWASDRMPLKYLLMLLVGCLGLGSLGLLAFEELWGRWLVISGYGIRGGALGLSFDCRLAPLLWTQTSRRDQWSFHGSPGFCQRNRSVAFRCSRKSQRKLRRGSMDFHRWKFPAVAWVHKSRQLLPPQQCMIPDHLVFKMFRPETQHFNLRISPVFFFQSRFST